MAKTSTSTPSGAPEVPETPVVVPKEKTKEEKIKEKAQSLALVGSVSKTDRNKNKIEIESISETDFGCVLFARAWDKNDNPIGFGEDGTVEVERFRLVVGDSEISYTLIPDKDGQVALEIEEDGEIKTRKYRKDTKEALLRRLEDVVDSVGKSGENIVKGKRGSTTTIVDHNTTDSKYVTQDGVSVWSTARNAATGVVYTYNAGLHNILHASQISTYYIRRADLVFDTSSIPDTDSVTGLTLTMYSNSSSGGDADTTDIDFFDNTNNANLNNPLVSEDYNDFDTTPIYSQALADFTNKGTNVTTSDFGSYDVVNKTGDTQIGLRLARDVDDSAPTGTNVLRIDGGADLSYITVTHSAAGSSIKEINGLAKASIKSWNGVTIA